MGATTRYALTGRVSILFLNFPQSSHMPQFTTPGNIIVTCNRRLGPLLAGESAVLGYEPTEVFPTCIRLQGTLNDCIRLNLSLRTASQVLYSLIAFTANDADALYKELSTFPWEDYLPEGIYCSITSNVWNDTINNSMFANLRVKDAMVDRLRAVCGTRPDTGAELRGAVFHLHWKDESAELFIDTSGPSLGRHGYRKIPGRAPMLEALAAATILATRWDKGSPFVNPMCGSGTLAIEAALIATNTAPGLFRDNFAFMHIAGYSEDFYLEERGKAEAAIREPKGLRIIATDYSEAAIENAKKNAQAAGVADLITFAVCDFAETEVPEGGRGVMMVNPEYGERLGDIQELEGTYKRIGDFMKSRCGGYWGYVFTGNLDLAKKIGLKPKRRIEFYTSKIDARLMEFELYEGSRRKTPEALPE